jgi:hypothetical protein
VVAAELAGIGRLVLGPDHPLDGSADFLDTKVRFRPIADIRRSAIVRVMTPYEQIDAWNAC